MAAHRYRDIHAARKRAIVEVGPDERLAINRAAEGKPGVWSFSIRSLSMVWECASDST